MDEAAALREVIQKLQHQVKELGLALVDSHVRMEATRVCVQDSQKSRRIPAEAAAEMLRLLGKP